MFLICLYCSFFPQINPRQCDPTNRATLYPFPRLLTALCRCPSAPHQPRPDLLHPHLALYTCTADRVSATLPRPSRRSARYHCPDTHLGAVLLFCCVLAPVLCSRLFRAIFYLFLHHLVLSPAVQLSVLRSLGFSTCSFCFS